MEADLIPLEMALGHRVMGSASSRYAIFGPGDLASVRQGIEDVPSDLGKSDPQALHARLMQKSESVVVLQAQKNPAGAGLFRWWA